MNLPRPTRASALDLRARAAALLQAREVARRESERLATARKRRLKLRLLEVRQEAEWRKRLRIGQGVPPLEASGMERLEVSRGAQEIQRLGRRRAQVVAKRRGLVCQLERLRQRLLDLAGRRARAARIRGRRAHYRARVEQRRAELLLVRQTGIRLGVEHVRAPDPERLLEALLGLARVVANHYR